MRICFHFKGKLFCINIPIYRIPIVFPPIPNPPDPGPYAGLFQDATILTAINDVSQHITEDAVRRSILNGIAEGVKGMQVKAGEDITLGFEKR